MMRGNGNDFISWFPNRVRSAPAMADLLPIHFLCDESFDSRSHGVSVGREVVVLRLSLMRSQLEIDI